MLTPYLLASIRQFSMKPWRGVWRLGRWAQRRQLRLVQQCGQGVQVFGPLYVQNVGHIQVGDNVVFRSSWHRPISLSVVDPSAHLVIEDNVLLNWGVTIGVLNQVTIGACSTIADDCIIYDTDWHSLNGLDEQVPAIPTKIGRGVWLCARVIVLKGVTVGDNTVIGANSTVTHDLPGNVLAAGTPARVIRTIDRRRYVPEG